MTLKNYKEKPRNLNLVKNMPFVKHDQIPPKKGPNSKGLKLNNKQVKKA
jgi:hypothetical protein